MSTQTVQTSQATTSETSQVVENQPVVKKSKITDSIVAKLKELPEGETMTISSLCEKLGNVKRQTLQATLSQMVKAKRVEKVVTGKRQPGYKAVK